jgi:TonB family protein
MDNGGPMNIPARAALLAASLLVHGCAGQKAATATPRGAGQNSAAGAQPLVESPVKGPKLGSPEIYQIGAGVQGPMITRESKPGYPAQAKANRIQGLIRMECVVLADGTIGDVKVTQPLDVELDNEAVNTIRMWQFKPGTVDGKPVPVQVMVEMSFSLK